MLSDEENYNHLRTVGFSHEEILNSTFDKNTIKKRYLTSARRLHPDKRPEDTQKFSSITEAKRILDETIEKKGALTIVEIDPRVTEYNNKVIKILEDRVQELNEQLRHKPQTMLNQFNAQDVRLFAAQALLAKAKEDANAGQLIDIDKIVANVQGPEKDVGLDPITSGMFKSFGFQSRTEKVLNNIRALPKPPLSESGSPKPSRR